MSHIFTGRYTAQTDKPFVLFLIGMRINKLWQVNKWWSVAKEMPPMLRTLAEHPEKGMLGGYMSLSWPTIVQVQYWRSFEDLEHFARNPDDPHAAAWQRFPPARFRSDPVPATGPGGAAFAALRAPASTCPPRSRCGRPRSR